MKKRTISTAANTNQKASKRSFLSGGKMRRARFRAVMVSFIDHVVAESRSPNKEKIGNVFIPRLFVVGSSTFPLYSLIVTETGVVSTGRVVHGFGKLCKRRAKAVGILIGGTWLAWAAIRGRLGSQSQLGKLEYGVHDHDQQYHKKGLCYLRINHDRHKKVVHHFRFGVRDYFWRLSL